MTTQPNNLRKNALGHFVPESLIAPLDLLRDDLVTRLCNEAHEEKLRLLARKASIAQEIEAFMDLSAAEYGVQYGGTKGNVTLTSFDGRFQVVRAIGEHRKFDERLQTAKTLIDGCIGRWSEGSSNEIRALVDHAFRVNKGGHVDVNQVGREIACYAFDLLGDAVENAIEVAVCPAVGGSHGITFFIQSFSCYGSAIQKYGSA